MPLCPVVRFCEYFPHCVPCHRDEIDARAAEATAIFEEELRKEQTQC